jgi:hypothetical protein
VSCVVRCPPSLPLGLGGECKHVATEALEPNESILFVTDGVLEGRFATGEPFGIDRLAAMWERQSASGHLPEEVLRRLVDAIADYNRGILRDDATLLQLCWYGPPRLDPHHAPPGKRIRHLNDRQPPQDGGFGTGPSAVQRSVTVEFETDSQLKPRQGRG